MTGPETPPIDDSIFRRVVEQSRDYAVFVLDPGGLIRTWNSGAQRLKGYRPEEIIGKHFSVFYTRAAVDSGWPAHELEVAAREGRFEDEGWRVRNDGSRFWANVIITALRDDAGHLIGFSKFTRDLTDRRLHEEALRQSEERFRLLVEGVQDYAICMLDTDGMVSSWNAGARRIKGYSREEIIGRHFSNFYTPEDVEAGKPWEALAAAKRDGHFEAEAWRVRKDGSRFWARAVLTPVYDDEGMLRGFAKVTQDLTERRQLRALEKAAQNVNEFIAMLAHELRNPLAPIRTAVQVMAHISEPARGEQLRQTIDRQSANLARIVDDLLDISRITRGVLDLQPAPADLAEIVRNAVDTVVPAIESRLHSLEVSAPPMPVTVVVDRLRMIQVVVNLLTNAARYTPQGGAISVAVEASGGFATVRVRDNGRGIEPEMQERIFDMFVQGRSPVERVSGGLGVGLALARRLVETHGGTLEVHSAGRDMGSEFVVRLRLPRTANVDEPHALPRESGEAPDEGEAPRGMRRILVVDDNADAAQTLQMLLSSLGHEVRVANDGREALDAAGEFRPDVVLLDIGMPGMDGYEVARRLRSLKGTDPPLRIVAVTGWGQDLDRHQSREAGFDVHLVKPVDVTQLQSVLAPSSGGALH